MPAKEFDAFTRLDASDVNAYLANKSISNAIINGGMDIWQRGTTFTNPANNAFTADRWFYSRGGSDPTSASVTRQSFTANELNVIGFGDAQFYRRTTVTTPGSVTRVSSAQRIEDVRSFAGQTVTLSFWAKADSTRALAGLYLIQAFGSGGSGDVASDNLSTSLNSITTTWQRFTVTYTFPSIAGKTIGDGSSLLLRIDQSVSAGSVLDLWGVQLEAGTVANDFRRNANSLQGELAACQRYYYRSSNSSAFGFHGLGSFQNTTTGLLYVTFPVTMRTFPSAIEFANLTSFSYSEVQFTFTSMNLDSAVRSSNSARCQFFTTGATAGQGLIVVNNNNTAGFLAFSAEL
jgi:hypothetical protein